MLKLYANYVIGAFILCILMLAGWIFTRQFVWLIMTSLLVLIEAGIILFFRDPDRDIPNAKDIVVSPADGRIMRIQYNARDEYCRGAVTIVSVFLRLWDVHVNRMPISGKVEMCKYKKGQFYAAMLNKASKYNERMLVGISSAHGRFLVKQVAGTLARRIVCHVHEDDSVMQGERFGLIKFGSLVELSIPRSYEVCVKKNQYVRAGETIIASLARK